MKKNKPFSFEEFKSSFYSRVDDPSLFDFGRYNALKIVLDGLKVNYAGRIHVRKHLFYPEWAMQAMFRARYYRYKRMAGSYFDGKYFDRPVLLYDNSGRYEELEDGSHVTFYYRKIINELRDRTVHIVQHRRSKKIVYDLEGDNVLYLRFSKPDAGLLSLRRELRSLYRRIDQSRKFTVSELQNIRVALTLFTEKVNYWTKILDRFTNLRFAIIEMHYHNEALVYCLKERGIPVYEIQHGLISRRDIFYVFPDSVKKIASRALFPDKLFVVGQYWKDIMMTGAEYSEPQKDIIVLGDFFYRTTTIIPGDKQEIDAFRNGHGTILISTQTFMHKEYIRYIEWLEKDLSAKQMPFKIIVKIHPGESLETYRQFKGSGRVLVTRANLSYLFSISLIHVSIYSTTLFDALLHGIANFSLASDFSQDYRDEILDAGVALPLEVNQNPADLLENNKEVGPPKPTSYFYGDFEEGKVNLMKELEVVMEGQQCTRCILDTHDDPKIRFDANGVCSYCLGFEETYGNILRMPAGEKDQVLQEMIRRIKEDGRGKKYDCICGVSGGVDSSFLAVRAKELGLRALLVHFDNGWNSELAVKNIEQVCRHTGFDLHTYVVDWEEFKDLQKAYIKAGVLDWEVPTDHGLWAVILKQAKKLNVKHVLIGANYQTEGILPKTMRYDKADLKNIRDIYKKHGTRKKLRSFPMYEFWHHMYLKIVWGLKLDMPLYYMEYNKDVSKRYLVEKVGWKDYGGKHYESIFTRFYQGYVLPQKFGFDKRKAHLASLICSGQITREQAVEELSRPAIGQEQLETDLHFFVKKMGFSAEEFEKIMQSPPVPHEHFKSYADFEYPFFKKLIGNLSSAKKFLRGNAKRQ